MRHGLKIVATFSTTAKRTSMKNAFVPGTVASLLKSLDFTDDSTAVPAWVWNGLFSTAALRDTARTSAIAAQTSATTCRVTSYNCYDDENPRKLSVATTSSVK